MKLRASEEEEEEEQERNDKKDALSLWKWRQFVCHAQNIVATKRARTEKDHENYVSKKFSFVKPHVCRSFILFGTRSASLHEIYKNKRMKKI